MLNKSILIKASLVGIIGGLGKHYFDGGYCSIEKDLSGQIVIITGSNTGIGKETARRLASLNATIIFACRDEQRTVPVIDAIKNETGNNNLEFINLDLGDFSSITSFSTKFSSKYDKLDILINNAGIMRLPQRELTKDGFESQIGINHFGHVYLTKLLLDKLKAAAPSRVINVASRAHERGEIKWDDLNSEKNYDPAEAYNQSKLANIMWTKELQNKLQGSNVKTVSLHPGLVRTELFRYSLEESWKKYLFYSIYPFVWYLTKNPEQGAQTSLYCALEEYHRLHGGGYYSDCQQKEPNLAAQNPENCKQLWDLTENFLSSKLKYQ